MIIGYFVVRGKLWGYLVLLSRQFELYSTLFSFSPVTQDKFCIQTGKFDLTPIAPRLPIFGSLFILVLPQLF